MLAYLTTHPELFGSGNEYTVFTAQPVLPPRARAAVGADVVKNYYEEEAEKVLAPVCKFLLRHGIDAKSVSTYRRRLLDKLDAKSNAELIALAIRHGYA